jgi:hypothetical protein
MNRIIIVLVGMLLFFSCKKDDIPPVPVLTPSGSFSMEYVDFNQDKSAQFLIENWLYSVLNVTFFSTISSATMIVPTIAYNSSFNFEPEYIGDQTWQWSYEFQTVGATYTAKLNGITQRRNKVKWEMYIEKIGYGGFPSFLWFEGTTVDSTSANWVIYENPSSPTEVINIEWDSNPVGDKTKLKYTYVRQADEERESIIEFENLTDETYDRKYSIFRSKSNTTINIEWNSLYKNGRVMSPNYFKDDNWHCWNSNLLDAWCD